MRKHLVVIPTYNEAENIQKIIVEIFHLYPDISVLVVDDSSPDGTGNIVIEMQEKYSRLYLLMLPKKSGLANAYINGFKWGIDNGFDLFTSCDADFSHKPQYIKDALKLIDDGYDVACGARYIKGGHTTEQHWFRNFISIGGNIWANFILGTHFSDILEGFNTYTIEALQKINIDSVGAKGFIFQTEMKYKATKKNCKIIEFPIVFEERLKGKSKMSSIIILEALFSIIRIRLGK